MKIVVAYNEYDVSKRALYLALQHAKAFEAEIQLITSLPGGAETTEEEIANAAKNLEQAKQKMITENVPGDYHLLIKGMAPGEDIVSFAEEHQADEIIMGIKKKSKVGKIIFGSTVQYVILKAPCPVVTVK